MIKVNWKPDFRKSKSGEKWQFFGKSQIGSANFTLFRLLRSGVFAILLGMKKYEKKALFVQKSVE